MKRLLIAVAFLLTPVIAQAAPIVAQIPETDPPWLIGTGLTSRHHVA